MSTWLEAVTGRPVADRPRATATRRLQAVACRLALLAVVAVGVAAVHVPRPRTLCLLRAFTGIPCPACGGTTAVVGLGHGDPVAGLAANPFAVAALGVLVVMPLGLGAAWARLPRRAQAGLVLAVVVASEVYQLVRFRIV